MNESEKNPKIYKINNLSTKGEVYEISFGQNPSHKQNVKPKVEIKPVVQEEFFIEEKSIILEPEENLEDAVVYEEEEVKKKISFFYRVLGKYFLCCQ